LLMMFPFSSVDTSLSAGVHPGDQSLRHAAPVHGRGVFFGSKPARTPGVGLVFASFGITPNTDIAARDVTYGDWRKLCFKPGGAKMLCRTSIIGRFATGQTAVRLDIVEREGDGATPLQVFSPVGMYLQNPVKLAVDQGKAYRVPIPGASPTPASLAP
jgi:invasion protein IalB